MSGHAPPVRIDDDPHAQLRAASRKATQIAQSSEFEAFLSYLRRQFPGRFTDVTPAVERDYLRVVDQHLKDLLPHMLRHIGQSVRTAFDFGCGSGGSAVALAMVYPQMRVFGTDISADEIAVARERAKLYGVGDRCTFVDVGPNQRLPFADGSFDFCLCSSVIEYVIKPSERKFCIQEMVRLTRLYGLLFFSVPNRLYPFEVHTRKWGWNYFPNQLKARTVDCTFWEVRRLARPAILRLRPTPFSQFLRPWSNFCVQKVDRIAHG